MRTLKELQSRRQGIEKINKIARAMEVVSATRLHRYEKDVEKIKPFIQAQKEVIGNLALRLKKINSIWTQSPANKKALAILISSDRGFCGSFNNQLFQKIQSLEEKESFSFIVIGKKGTTYLKRHNFNVIDNSAFPDEAQIEDFARRIGEKVISSYRTERQAIYFIFNKFRRNLLGETYLEQIFPLEAQKDLSGKSVLDYLFEPDMEVLLERILPLYVSTEIKSAILESRAAEEMARMVAMTQATRSADDLIKSLTLQYHKARQAGITRELIEITNATIG